MNVTLRAAKHTDLEQLNELMFDLHHHHHLASPEHFKTAEEIEQEKALHVTWMILNAWFMWH